MTRSRQAIAAVVLALESGLELMRCFSSMGQSMPALGGGQFATRFVGGIQERRTDPRAPRRHAGRCCVNAARDGVLHGVYDLNTGALLPVQAARYKCKSLFAWALAASAVCHSSISTGLGDIGQKAVRAHIDQAPLPPTYSSVHSFRTFGHHHELPPVRVCRRTHHT